MFNLCSTVRRGMSRAKYWRKSTDRKATLNQSRNVHSAIGGADSRGKNESFRSKTLTSGRSFSNSVSGDLKLSTDNILRSPYGDLTFPDDLVHEFVWKNLDRWADKTALVCVVTGRSYTYAQFRKLSGRLATTLRKNKLYPGDTIAIVLPNIPEFAIVILAASEAGLQISPVNGAYTPLEIDRQLKNSDACAVVTIPKLYPVVKESMAHNPNIRLPAIVVDDGSGTVPDGSIRFSELVAEDIEEFWKIEKTERVKGDTLVLPYSSGTTGLPKGVELAHSNIVANCIQNCEEQIKVMEETTKTNQDVLIEILPMFHTYGLTVLIYCLSLGAKVVFLPRFDPSDLLHCLKEYRPRVLYLVPPLISFLADHEAVTSQYLDSLRYVYSAAAPVDYETVERFQKRTSHKSIVMQGYGLSEASPTVSAARKTGIDRLDSVGPLVPNTEARIVDLENNNGQNLGIGESGEILLRGPQIMKGYYKNPEATANAMDGEWLRTGDLGYFDDKGLLTITNRLKELIKVKGLQVAPAELEDLLRSNNKVLDVAVVGQAHETFGEIPRAFVVPRPGVALNEDEVKAFVAERLSKHKHLGSVKFVDSIPKSSTGKVLRLQLKDQ